MLSLIFLPIDLILSLALLPLRLMCKLIRSGVGLTIFAGVAAVSLFCTLLNVMRPLTGLIFLVAGLTLLYHAWVNNGGEERLREMITKVRAR
ncbi:MAG: hypothetical protein IKP40_14545 [Clostridia bacterium]|nr:hypothetical protein [Clostridia bacterium]